MSSRRRVRDGLTRNKERASMSFMIVIMFFIVFVIIVVTEVLLMDERGNRGAGVLVRRGSIIGVSHRRSPDKPDYDDFLKNEDDYLTYHGPNAIIVPDPIIDNVMKAKEVIMMDKRETQANVVNVRDALDCRGRDGRCFNSKQPLSSYIEAKLPKLNPNLTAHDGKWQSVGGTRYSIFVSAYYERRKPKRSIRIIGATRTRLPERVWCRFWYEPSNDTPSTNSTPMVNSTSKTPLTKSPASLTVLGEVKVIRENWNLKYSACYILCPLKKVNGSQAITTVSVVSKLGFPAANRLIIRNLDKDVDITRIPNSIGVCVKPIHFDYDQDLAMLEFLELNSLMGVSDFTFYVKAVGKKVDCVLKEYQRAFGINITTLPWKLDMISQQEIRTEGIFMALNDCLYRNMYRHSYLVFIDLDEYIMPTNSGQETLQDLIKWMGEKMNTKNSGAYSFQNAFFYKNWADDKAIYDSSADELHNVIKQSMISLRKTRRKIKLHPHKQRSKLILRPETVLEVGNHFVWEFLPGFGTFNVPPAAGLLHHYRECEFGGPECTKTQSIIDRTAYKYEDKLIRRVGERFANYSQKCKLELPKVRLKQPDRKVPPAVVVRKDVSKYRRTNKRSLHSTS